LSLTEKNEQAAFEWQIGFKLNTFILLPIKQKVTKSEDFIHVLGALLESNKKK